MKLFHLISDIFNVAVKADDIRRDEIKRPKSMIFGVTSIIYSIIAVACAIGGAAVLSVSTDSLLFIFLIVIGVVLMVFSPVSLIGSLVRVIAQLRINRRAIGWIALVVFIAAIAGSVLGIVLILT